MNHRIITYLSIIFFSFFFQSYAFAILSISPERVIFQKKDRTKEIVLINTSNEEKSFRIYFKNMKMISDGSYKEIEVTDKENSDFLFADKYIRYSPRQITLAAGETQSIRLLLRKKKQMKEGEYRSHLIFAELPKQSSSQATQSDEFQIKINALFGISIPVIVRHGDLTQSALVKNVKIDEITKELYLELHRDSQASSYGNIHISFRKNNQSKFKEIKLIKGISILPPLNWRSLTLPLAKEYQENNIVNGEIKVKFINDEQENKGEKKVSESIIKI